MRLVKMHVIPALCDMKSLISRLHVQLLEGCINRGIKFVHFSTTQQQQHIGPILTSQKLHRIHW